MPPPLQNCCCCELKTGVIIIATLGWIFTLLKVFLIIGVATNTSGGSNGQPGGFLAYQIVYTLIAFTFCVLMIVGVYKKNRYLLLPWMILNCIEYILVSIAAFVFFVFIFTSGGSGIVIGLFVLLAAISALCWYLWVVVLSYYKQLAEESTIQTTMSEGHAPPAYEKNLA